MTGSDWGLIVTLGVVLAIGALLGGLAGYWAARIEQTKEATMSYRSLHSHVHARLGLKPPRGHS